MNSINKPIVIVGSGFAGLNAAINLKNLNCNLPIVVVDSQSQFIFKPLMYEILSGEINLWEFFPNFEKIYAKYGITFIKNEVESIDLDEQFLTLKDSTRINYQYLVLSTGSTQNTFSIKGVQEHALFFNTLSDLKKLKNYLENSKNTLKKKKLAIIGAGPSGVELACKIHDSYKNFEILLFEASNEILGNSKVFNREEGEKALNLRGIKILKKSLVEEVSEKSLIIKNKQNEFISYEHDGVIWTAGVKPILPNIFNNLQKEKERILVNEKLQTHQYGNVFAVGDISIIEGFEDLQVNAQKAMQQGDHVAKNINLLISDKDLIPFEYKDNGEMISLGIGYASISGLGITMSGKFAFDLRRLIYASKMPLLETSFKSAASWLISKKPDLANFFR
tara:strand:- start:1057 stop:2232 length:1176 start_codon:yes stop_codon:yes gene_type:complete